MTKEPPPEDRLERIEERLQQLELHQEEGRRLEKRRRRQEFRVRIVLIVVVGIAYVLYLRSVTGMG